MPIDLLPATLSGGGPIIALPAEVAEHWRGNEPPRGAVVPPGWEWGDGGLVTDYDRACDSPQDKLATEYGGVGWLDVAGAAALVFDAELITRWLAEPWGGVVLRRDAPDQPNAARALLAQVLAWRAFARPLVLTEGRLYLFDSAYAGAHDPAAIEAGDGVVVAEPGPGTYDLSVGELEGMDLTRLVRRSVRVSK